jgi:hypothetical protein
MKIAGCLVAGLALSGWITVAQLKGSVWSGYRIVWRMDASRHDPQMPVLSGSRATCRV